MASLRIGAMLMVLLLGAGCETGASRPAAPPAQAATPPAAPQASAVATPSPALLPRREWRRIPLGRGARMSGAYVASRVVTNEGGIRRVWMVVNLAEPIRLPETGGTARSTAYLADFRCDHHAWSPVEGIWFGQRNAVGEVLREQMRGPAGIRDVTPGSFIDLFVNAACRP